MTPTAIGPEGTEGVDSPGVSLDFNQVHEEYREPIGRYLRRLTRNAHEADDLTQEVFLRVHDHLPSFRGDSTIKTWVYRIASHLFIDQRRRAADRLRKKMKRLDTAGPVDPEDKGHRRPEEDSIRAEQAACVDDYVDRLPPTYRAALVLHDMEGLTNPEIADVLQCSLATVKIRLHRARERLKEAMNRGCDISHDDRGTLVCDPKEKEEGGG